MVLLSLTLQVTILRSVWCLQLYRLIPGPGHLVSLDIFFHWLWRSLMRLSWLANGPQSLICLHLFSIKILLAGPGFLRNENPTPSPHLVWQASDQQSHVSSSPVFLSQVLFSFPVIASILAQTIQYKGNLNTDVIHSPDTHSLSAIWLLKPCLCESVFEAGGSLGDTKMIRSVGLLYLLDASLCSKFLSEWRYFPISNTRYLYWLESLCT